MKRIVFTALAVLAACACQKVYERPEECRLPIRLSLQLLQTRATDTANEEGDKVGLYVSYGETLTASGNYVDNSEHTLSGGVWQAAGALYWKDQTTPADFYCYYPFSAVTDAGACAFSVQTDQRTLEAYKASDFLYGKSLGVAPTGTVQIVTSHLLSNVQITLKPGKGFTEAEFEAAEKSLKIENLQTAASIDLASGTVTPVGEKGSVLPYWTGEAYRALVVPQQVAASATLLTVTVGGAVYSTGMDLAFVSGTRHQLQVKVDKSAACGIRLSIEDWTVDEEIHEGTAV